MLLPANDRHNVLLLATAQALMMSANAMIIATAALVGAALAPDPLWTTLPLALQFVATMVMTLPAGGVLNRWGYRCGFLWASLLGMVGAILTAVAIMEQQFLLFTLGMVAVGAFNAFGNFFRFTAADSVATEFKAVALAYVVAGGVVAAFIGPNLARQSQYLLAEHPFAASYLSLLLLYLLLMGVVSRLRLSPSRFAVEVSGEAPLPARPLRQIVREDGWILAVMSSVVGYAVMTLVMTATPLAMVCYHYPFQETSWVIQWHVVGMFAPSLITGRLIGWWGVRRVIGGGVVLSAAAVVVNLNGTSIDHFWWALLLLGVGWNWLFIGGSTLLTTLYRPAERTRVQSVHDFMVFTTVALASLGAAPLQDQFGWVVVNQLALPLLVLVVVLLVIRRPPVLVV